MSEWATIAAVMDRLFGKGKPRRSAETTQPQKKAGKDRSKIKAARKQRNRK